MPQVRARTLGANLGANLGTSGEIPRDWGLRLVLNGVDESAIVGGRQAVDQDVVPGPIGNVKAMVNVVHRHSAFVEAIRKGQAHELETVAAPSETVMHMVAGVRAGREQAAIVIGGICRDRGNRR